MSKPKVLFYDIETTPLQVWTFSLGKTVLSHKQLVEGKYSAYDIISISYMWEHENKAHVLDWGWDKQDSSKMIKEFDKVLKQADIAIAQNGDRFDIKHLNTLRLIKNLPPFPESLMSTDDTLKQMKKYFYFPSYSLDYVSKLFDLGGKMKMDLQDWVNIVEKKDKKSFDRMLRYNKKDVRDLKKLYKKIEPHIIPKLNKAMFTDNEMACRTCGSSNIHKNGTRVLGNTKYQTFYCRSHGGYAGRASILKNGKYGKIR